MGKTLAQVAACWKEGKPGKTSRGSMSTNGVDLFSYKLLIGITLKYGTKIAMDRVPISISTYRHLNTARRVADKLTYPFATGYGYDRYQIALELFPTRITSIQELESIEPETYLFPDLA